jgi:signal transduction histidine kinase
MTKEMIEKHMLGKLEVENVDYEYEGSSYKGAQFTINLPMQ